MRHVLIIEDESMIAEHLAALAEDGGATSIEVTTAERQAVEAARATTRHHPGRRTPAGREPAQQPSRQFKASSETFLSSSSPAARRSVSLVVLQPLC